MVEQLPSINESEEESQKNPKLVQSPLKVPPSENSESTEIEPGVVVGLDSLNNQILPGDMVITITNTVQVQPVRNPYTMLSLANTKKAGVVFGTGNSIETAVNHIDVELFPQNTWINLHQLKPYKDEDSTRPPEIALNEDLKKLEVRRLQSENGELTVQLVDNDRDRKYKPAVIKQGRLNNLGTSYIPPVAIVEKDGNEYLAFVKLETDLPEMQTVFERYENLEQVIGVLQKDFPWLTQEDAKRYVLENLMFDTQTLGSEYIHSLSTVEQERIKRLYPQSRWHDFETGIIQEKLTPAEKQYLTIRNYAYLCEFGAVLKYRVAPKNMGELKRNAVEELKGLTPQERHNLAVETLAMIETNVKDLLEPRLEEEKRLFGETIHNPYTSYLQRFASADTVTNYQRAVGLYMQGTLALITDRSILDSKHEINFRDGLLRKVADTCAHEIGHMGLKDTRAGSPALGNYEQALSGVNFRHEEAWNTWKSLILPEGLRYKNEDDISLYSLDSPRVNPFYDYLGRVVTKEDGEMIMEHHSGGALAIEGMVNTAITTVVNPFNNLPLIYKDENGNVTRLDRDTVLKSALATANARIEEGVFQFMGQEVIGFKSLYDFLTTINGEQSYQEILTGSSDRDYREYSDYVIKKQQKKRKKKDDNGLRTYTLDPRIDESIRYIEEGVMKKLYDHATGKLENT